jgi:hypothetical protein
LGVIPQGVALKKIKGFSKGGPDAKRTGKRLSENWTSPMGIEEIISTLKVASALKWWLHQVSGVPI